MSLATVILILGFLFLATTPAGRKVLATVFVVGILAGAGLVALDSQQPRPISWSTPEAQLKLFAVKDEIRDACEKKRDDRWARLDRVKLYENATRSFSISDACGNPQKVQPFDAAKWTSCLIARVDQKRPGVTD
jgi:hypothetical protein